MSNNLKVIGTKYNHLTAIRKTGTHPTQRTHLYLWRCDCGNEREIEARRVVSGRTKTCGKCQYKHKLLSTAASSRTSLGKRITKEYSKYLAIAERRKLNWQITLEYFSKILPSPCTLCGTPPTPTTYNRIEVAYPNSHYTQGNIYHLCPQCASTFNKVGLSQIISQILACHRHLTNK